MKQLFLLATLLCCVTTYADSIFIEAENFQNKGGWVTDPQFYEQMGSAYLLAHGNGQPVADASTSFEIKVPGKYYIMARTRNWVANWFSKDEYAPGVFKIKIDGQVLSTVYGKTGLKWHFQSGDAINLKPGVHTLSLADQTGFGARCDVIAITQNPKQDIYSSDRSLAKYRETLYAPKSEAQKYDFVVIGGGVAGIAAALKAARMGLSVCLLNNRPVWGGNNSVEHKIVVSGDLQVSPFPRLGAVVNEYKDIYLRPKGIDSILKSQKNLTLMSNTQAIDVRVEGGEIKQILAMRLDNNFTYAIAGRYFADCSGDGFVAYKAGADYTMGREIRTVYGENLAPEIPGFLTFGITLKWRSKEADTLITFPKLPWAVQFSDQSVLKSKANRWFWETGFQKDQIRDAEENRDYMLRVIYGNWSFLKNSPDTKSEYAKLALDEVSYIAGKRESRRFFGDVIFTQKDVEGGWKQYSDALVAGTYPMDQHFPSSENSIYFPGAEFQAMFKHDHHPIGYDLVYVHPEQKLPVYFIPYRCLYSRNIKNLFFAGRNVSASRMAFSSTRVQACTGMMGEVVGYAAGLCVRYKCKPAQVYSDHLGELLNEWR